MSPLLGLALVALLIAVWAFIRSERARRAIEREQMIQLEQLEIIDDQLREIWRRIRPPTYNSSLQRTYLERSRYWP